MSLFDIQAPPVERPDIFDHEFVPEPLPVREEDFTQVQGYIRNAISSGGGVILLRGPPGTGKTTIVRRVIDSDCENTPNDWTYFEANPENSSYRELIRFVNALRSGPPLGKTGYSRDTIQTELERELSTVVNPVGIALDAVTASTHEELIQCLLSSANGHSDLSIPVVITTRTEMSHVVPQEFRIGNISLSYSINELMEILKHLMDKGCDPDQISPEVVPLCAAYGLERDDFAHGMIDVFKRSLETAQEDLSSEITGNHVEEAKRQIETTELKSRLQLLDDHAILVLHAMWSLSTQTQESAVSEQIWTEYDDLCSRAPVNSLSKRRFHDRLQTLHDSGALTYTTINEGRKGGRYREYSLAVSPERLQRIVKDVTNFPVVNREVQ